MDLIFAGLAAAMVLGAAAALIRRTAVDVADPGVYLVAGIAAGAAAALVFLVPQVDLVPDQLDGGMDIVVLVVSGATIAALGWRRRRAG